jgi:hypothetical protein
MKFAGIRFSSTLSSLSLVVVLAGALGAATVYTHAQSVPSPGAYSVSARTMDSRTWTRSVTTTDPVSGMVTSLPESYQELGNGICYRFVKFVQAGAKAALWRATVLDDKRNLASGPYGNATRPVRYRGCRSGP